MTRRLACPPAPGPLEDYAARFDDLFGTLAQQRGFRAYLRGLLLPRERTKTLTALAGAESVVGAQHPEVQRLQFFLSEAPWDAEAINARRLEVLFAAPPTRPTTGASSCSTSPATARTAPRRPTSRGSTSARGARSRTASSR